MGCKRRMKISWWMGQGGKEKMQAMLVSSTEYKGSGILPLLKSLDIFVCLFYFCCLFCNPNVAGEAERSSTVVVGWVNLG